MNDLYARLHEIETPGEALAESADFPTIPTGTYRLEVTKKDLRQGEETFRDGTPNPNAGRISVRVSARAFVDGVKAGTVNFSASPELVRKDDGRLDLQSKLWANLAAIHGTRNAAEVFDAIDSIPYKARVGESFDTPEGLKPADTKDKRQGYQEAGYEARNFVFSLGKVA